MVTRISTPMIYQRALSAMLSKQSEASETQYQISTGKRILSPADDPAGATRILDYTKEVETLEQYLKNADRANARLGYEESVIQEIENIFQRVRELTIQGSSDALSLQNRQAIATEMWELRKELISLANSKDAQGEYIFSGYQTDTRPFVELVPGTVTYQGDYGSRELQISQSRWIADGNPGSEVFMDIDTGAGTQDMFQAIYQIATDLDNGLNVTSYIDDLDQVQSHVLTVHASIGARMNAIDEQVAVNEDVKLVMEMGRSKEEDLDYAEAITRFERQMTALEAAQQTYVRVSQLSLFNFLR
jgi:flagellar hook-associated protein 3 FlgL